MGKERLFYHAYQDFYKMAETSRAFSQYCENAFGADFSQDGFGDLFQLNLALSSVELSRKAKVLDIGCGNGKMLEYIASENKEKQLEIFGFDYSEVAINAARTRLNLPQNFQTAPIGEIEYPADTFDLILAMDSIYFAPDMATFLFQIYTWLKPGGIFLCAYQEGDVMDKTKTVDTTVFAQSCRHNGLSYTVRDITELSYRTLQNKRDSVLSLKHEFQEEDNEAWFLMILQQSEPSLLPYEQFCQKYARYLYQLQK